MFLNFFPANRAGRLTSEKRCRWWDVLSAERVSTAIVKDGPSHSSSTNNRAMQRKARKTLGEKLSAYFQLERGQESKRMIFRIRLHDVQLYCFLACFLSSIEPEGVESFVMDDAAAASVQVRSRAVDRVQSWGGQVSLRREKETDFTLQLARIERTTDKVCPC